MVDVVIKKKKKNLELQPVLPSPLGSVSKSDLPNCELLSSAVLIRPKKYICIAAVLMTTFFLSSTSFTTYSPVRDYVIIDNELLTVLGHLVVKHLQK